jgi:hypothetical protein
MNKETVIGTLVGMVGVSFLIPVILAVTIFTTAAYVFFGWNWFLHEVFGLKEITFGQAVGAGLLVATTRSVVMGLVQGFVSNMKEKK